jgi:hypothetical protein
MKSFFTIIFTLYTIFGDIWNVGSLLNETKNKIKN